MSAIAEETTSVHYGTVGLPDLKRWVGDSGTADVETAVRDSNFEQVLDIIPANALRTFQYAWSYAFHLVLPTNI